jgi:hypothetical protein
MRLTMLGLMAALALVACSEERSVQFDVADEDTSFADAEVRYAPGDQFAALSRDGVVKLGLTQERVYFTASDAVREHVDSTLEREMTESDSRVARAISGAVRRGVQSALRFDVDFRVDEIHDVEYVDGELEFDWVDPDDDRTLRNVEVDGQRVTRAFDEESGRAFVRAFRRVKRGDTLRDDTAADDTAAAVDTAGGASF